MPVIVPQFLEISYSCEKVFRSADPIASNNHKEINFFLPQLPAMPKKTEISGPWQKSPECRVPFFRSLHLIRGTPPLSYVTNWRIQIAAQFLRKDFKMSLSRVSEEVEYLSLHAFSKDQTLIPLAMALCLRKCSQI